MVALDASLSAREVRRQVVAPSLELIALLLGGLQLQLHSRARFFACDTLFFDLCASRLRVGDLLREVGRVRAVLLCELCDGSFVPRQELLTIRCVLRAQLLFGRGQLLPMRRVCGFG
ncbi:MAG: hypothetical protein RL701_5823, partial [Pseudomonadota bacterium]